LRASSQDIPSPCRKWGEGHFRHGEEFDDCDGIEGADACFDARADLGCGGEAELGEHAGHGVDDDTGLVLARWRQWRFRRQGDQAAGVVVGAAGGEIGEAFLAQFACNFGNGSSLNKGRRCFAPASARMAIVMIVPFLSRDHFDGPYRKYNLR
jgi:hypothetical protein